MKQFVVYLLLIVPMAFFTACSKDEDNQNERPTNEVNDGSGNDGYVGDHVIINDDGTTSNGSLFSAIDNTNFYLDYVKYSVVEGHLEVSGYDKAGFKGEAKIVSKITYKGNTYEVLTISRSAFYSCKVLTSIKMPNSVTSIGLGAFSGCSGLTSIVIDKSNSIYDSRDNCNAIITTQNNELIVGSKNTTIPNSVKSIGGYAFSGCSGLTSITIPNSVTSIGYQAFSGCSGLTSITIPNSVKSIEEYTFNGCTGLTSVTIGNSVTSIGNRAFSGCTGLTSVTIGNSVTSIGNSAFYGCTSLTSITIPNSVTSIERYAFYGCSGLTSVTIGNSVKSIGEYAFSDCTGLTSITIPNSVKSIEEYTFNGCTGLTSVTIGNSVTSIGNSAFSGCKGLTSVTIPNSVKSIGYQAFYGCNYLKKVIVSDIAAWCGISFSDYDSNPLYNAHNLYSDENTKITDLIIPNSVTSIRTYAFYGCSGLTSVTIGNSVTSIGGYAFGGCSGLTTITSLNTTPPTIIYYAFSSYNATLKVPTGSKSAYRENYYWRNFTNIVEIDPSGI